MAEGEKTVRDDSRHTMRDDASAMGGGGRTVREGSDRTVREDAAAPRGGATVREGPAPPRSTAGTDAQGQHFGGWLPASLAADYRLIEALPAQGGEADLYVVCPTDEPDPQDAVRRVAKVYRQGIVPKEDVLQRVRDADPGHVVQLHDFGQDGGRWWELMEYVTQGSLRMLIEREGPRLPDPLIMAILGELNEALAGLHRLDMEHRDLKPGNVLVRSREPLELVLTDFGITSVMDAAVHFTNTARTIRYAPPEAIGSVVSDEAERRSMVVIEHTTWDYWSLGMMLLEMLTGERPYAGLAEAVIAHQLATQNTEELTEAISDPNWRKLCRGLLRRTPSLRWDTEAVSKWMADPNDPDLDVANEAASAASPGLGPTATIDFDGRAYSTPPDLGLALSEDWEKAESFWKRRYGDVRTWLSDGLGLQALGDAIAAIDDGNYSLDTQVFSFIYHLAPEAPLRFRNQSISVERTAALCERAVLDADDEATAALLALYRQRILMLASSLPDQQALADLSARWDETVRDHESLRQQLGTHGVTVPELDDDRLAMLLAASMPDSPLVPRLKDLAWRACTQDAWYCDWFRERFGHPDEMPLAAIAIIPYVHAAAERRGRAARKRPHRGLVGGLIAGAVFGFLVLWADEVELGESVYDPPAFESGAGLGGLVLLLLLILVIRVAIAWYRGSEGTGWEHVLFGSDENAEDAVDFSWRTLLAHENAPTDGTGGEDEDR